ncbi:hypothetical protein SBDP2_1380008 [Syntrophobacter sp. SbD2]|nr:hypothetical protein SBDP2_1380008 [Syntrophobacter sp. SbD2]
MEIRKSALERIETDGLVVGNRGNICGYIRSVELLLNNCGAAPVSERTDDGGKISGPNGGFKYFVSRG